MSRISHEAWGELFMKRVREEGAPMRRSRSHMAKEVVE